MVAAGHQEGRDARPSRSAAVIRGFDCPVPGGFAGPYPALRFFRHAGSGCSGQGRGSEQRGHCATGALSRVGSAV